MSNLIGPNCPVMPGPGPTAKQLAKNIGEGAGSSSPTKLRGKTLKGCQVKGSNSVILAGQQVVVAVRHRRPDKLIKSNLIYLAFL